MNSTGFLNFANDFTHYGGYPMVIVGVLGNILAIFVLFRPKLKESNIRMYLLALSFNDIGVFTISLMDKWLRHSYGIEFRLKSVFGCKLLPFMDKYLLEMSSCIVLLISIERMAAITYPIKYHNFRGRHQPYVLGILLLVIVAFNSPLFYYYTLKPATSVSTAKCFDSAAKNIIMIKYIIFYILYWILPVLGILISSGIIIHILRTRTKPSVIQKKQKTFLKLNKQGREGIYLLVMISSLFLLCTSPFAICGIVITMYKGDRDSTYAKNVFAVFVLAHFFSYFNNAVNFLVYMLASANFRNEMKAFLRIKSK